MHCTSELRSRDGYRMVGSRRIGDPRDRVGPTEDGDDAVLVRQSTAAARTDDHRYDVTHWTYRAKCGVPRSTVITDYC